MKQYSMQSQILPTLQGLPGKIVFLLYLSSMPVSEEIFEVLNKYHQLDYQYIDFPVLIGGVINEAPEGFSYLFNRKDLTDYEKKALIQLRQKPFWRLKKYGRKIREYPMTPYG